MKTKLLAVIAAVGGMVFGSSAYAVSCPSAIPILLSAVPALSPCTDAADADLQFTFDSAVGFPVDTTFSLTELQIAGVDFYSVNLFFPSGFSSSGTFTYDLTVLNTEQIVAANLDTTLTKETGEMNYDTTKAISSDGVPLLSLTSHDGSADPATGETPLPAPQTTIHVVDTFTPGTGVAAWTSSINSFQLQVPRRAPEPATLALLGLGLLGMAAFRRRSN